MIQNNTLYYAALQGPGADYPLSQSSQPKPFTRRVPRHSVQRLQILPFPPPFRRRPAFVPFLRTNLISTLADGLDVKRRDTLPDTTEVDLPVSHYQ
jgi:hypothetical protein